MPIPARLGGACGGRPEARGWPALSASATVRGAMIRLRVERPPSPHLPIFQESFRRCQQPRPHPYPVDQFCESAVTLASAAACPANPSETIQQHTPTNLLGVRLREIRKLAVVEGRLRWTRMGGAG